MGLAHPWMLQVCSHQGRAVLPASDSMASNSISSWGGDFIAQLIHLLSGLPKANFHSVVINGLSFAMFAPFYPSDSPDPRETNYKDKESVAKRNYTPVVFF